MTTNVSPHLSVALIVRLGQALRASGDAAFAGAQRLDAWLATRAKSVDDHYALISMNARALRDIGIDATQVHGPAERCHRDWIV